MQFFESMQVMNYDETASQVYQRLTQSDRELAKRRLGKDMRIASLAKPLLGESHFHKVQRSSLEINGTSLW